MKPQVIAIATIAALAAGIGSASAANNQAISNKSMSSMAKDNLTLTPAQERTAWKDISGQARSQTAPNFKASVGATVPGDVSLRAIPTRVATRVSALKPYDYALMHNKLVIVNPSDKKVVDVINRRA